ncbi:39S ribosomal protein L20, mitochondrial [Halotydeus destructor]|nr:39S ribosomal protein L20, mitochondrial [Halotydeus destructor]
MVNLTNFLCKYMPSWLPRGEGANVVSHVSTRMWLKKHQMFKLTRFFVHRRRNCYNLARKNFLKSMQFSMKCRKDKAGVMRDIFSQRIWSACHEHRFPYKYLMGTLPQMGIELDRKSLANLAIWEPRTFESLVQLCKAKVAEHPVGEAAEQLEVPPGVITRGML